MTASRLQGLCVAMATALLLAAPAGAQQVDESAVQQMGIDPISFRAPDPKDQYKEIYIEQKLDTQVPLGLEFVDESGKTVKLGDYFNRGKPVVLSLVYFECPMLCTEVLNGMVAGFDGKANTLSIGEDYDVISVSIDPTETPPLALEKKKNYLAGYHRPGGEAGWHFLTGKQEEIETLAQAVGFRYFYDAASDQYAHASGIMILTPTGKISTYYLGIEYLPGNLEISLDEAARSVIGSVKDQLVLLCYRYDPTTGTYGLLILNALRVGGFLTVAAIVAFWVVSYWVGRKRRLAEAEAPGAGGSAAHPSHG